MSTSDWIKPGFLEVRDNQLYFDGHSAAELAREHGTPLFVFSEARIRGNIDRIRASQAVIDSPLKICYAAKAASTMAILKCVKDAGSDIEVNSGGELWKALKAGFTGDQIIFNGTSKEIWELEMAINAGIYAIQVDSLYELSLIEETAKRLGKRANVSLRLVPEIETKTHSGLQTALLTSKFGMMPDEAFEAFRTYKDSPDLRLAGIHLHIGSQNPDADVYADAFEMLYTSLLHIYKDAGVKLQHVNLGGGFPVKYSDGIESHQIAAQEDAWVSAGRMTIPGPGGTAMELPVSKEVSERVERRRMFAADYAPSDAIGEAWKKVSARARNENSEHLLQGLTILLEPGRSVIADTAICLTSVRNHKERPLAEINEALADAAADAIEESLKAGLGSGSGFGSSTSGVLSVGGQGYQTHKGFLDPNITAEHWLLTDAGFNLLLSMETYKWYYHMVSAERAVESHDFPYKIAGPLCDGGDVYFDNEENTRLPEYRMLPSDVQPGEVLALLNCGAYSLAQASQYNGRFLPPVVLTRVDGTAEVIRRRDTFEDLIGSDVV